MASKIADAANDFAEREGTDVFLFNGRIERPWDRTVIKVLDRRRRDKVLVFLVTLGGNPDAAYRIARAFQRAYPKRFTLFVSGYCKSAGTLVAIAANQIVMSDNGELGPLDVQLSKSDELWQMRSGHTGTDALSVVETRARDLFKATFLEIKKSFPSVTLKTAMQMASEFSGSLYGGIFSQIDPMNLGEAARELRIATQYGNRLCKESGNVEEDKLPLLVASYPSHAFVIDRDEASTLFKVVREPNGPERELERAVGAFARYEVDDGPYIEYLSQEVPEVATLVGVENERETAEGDSANSAEERPTSEEVVGNSESGAVVAQVTSITSRN